MNSSHLESFGFPLMGDTTTVYLCVARGNRILHSHSNGGSKERRGELEALAALCLEGAPPFHSWYSHTAGGRTVGLLMEDGYTYAAIADPSSGALRPLLESVRDGFKKAAKNGVQDELVPVVRSLIASLETMPRPADHTAGNGKSSGRRDRVADAGDAGDAVKIDVPSEPAMGLRKSLSSSSSSMKARGQKAGRRLWCRHVKIVIAADALLCLILFGVWLGVCRGLRCVSSG